MEATVKWLVIITVNCDNVHLCTLKECLTRGEDSCTNAKPLFWPVCLSLMRRMLLDERLAYGARDVKMASTLVIAAIFLRMIAVQDKSLYLKQSTMDSDIFHFKLSRTLHI